MNKISGMTLALAGLVLAPACVAQMTERDNVHLRNDCRLATQVLSKGQPDPQRDWALGVVSACEETGGAAVASLWAAPPADTTSLDQLYRISAGILDAQVLAAAQATASDPARPTLLRMTALRVLAAYVDSQLEAPLASVTPPPEGRSCESPDPAGCVYPAQPFHLDYRRQTESADPPPPDWKSSILTTLSALANSDPDRTILFAAARLRGWLTD